MPKWECSTVKYLHIDVNAALLKLVPKFILGNGYIHCVHLEIRIPRPHEFHSIRRLKRLFLSVLNLVDLEYLESGNEN